MVNCSVLNSSFFFSSCFSHLSSSVPKTSQRESISDSDPDASLSNNTISSRYSSVKKYKPTSTRQVRLGHAVIRTSASSSESDPSMNNQTYISATANASVISSTDSIVTTVLPTSNLSNDNNNNDNNDDGIDEDDTSELSSAVSVLASTLKRGSTTHSSSSAASHVPSNEYLSWNTYPSQQLHAYYNRNVPKDYRYSTNTNGSSTVGVAPYYSADPNYAVPSSSTAIDPNTNLHANNYYHFVPNNDYYYYYPVTDQHSSCDVYSSSNPTVIESVVPNHHHLPSQHNSSINASATLLSTSSLVVPPVKSPRSKTNLPLTKTHPSEEDDDDNDNNNEDNINSQDYPEDAEIYLPRNESEYITMSDPVKALHAVKGKMVDQERQQVDYLIDLVKTKKLIVARGDLARMLQDKVNPSRPREFYEKLVSRKNLNIELAPFLTIRKVRRRRTTSSLSVPSTTTTNLYSKISAHSSLSSDTMVPMIAHRA